MKRWKDQKQLLSFKTEGVFDLSIFSWAFPHLVIPGVGTES
jgi:hypothetical protein